MRPPAASVPAPARRPAALSGGFTLMELMITMAIIGILAAIAYPSYLAYTHRADRTDATTTMFSDSQILERCYAQTYDYTQCLTTTAPAGVTGVPAGPAPTPQGYYSITVQTPSTDTYTITATPAQNPQTSDSDCTSFTLNQTGQQTSTGSAAASTCWGSD